MNAQVQGDLSPADYLRASQAVTEGWVALSERSGLDRNFIRAIAKGKAPRKREGNLTASEDARYTKLAEAIGVDPGAFIAAAERIQRPSRPASGTKDPLQFINAVMRELPEASDKANLLRYLQFVFEATEAADEVDQVQLEDSIAALPGVLDLNEEDRRARKQSFFLPPPNGLPEPSEGPTPSDVADVIMNPAIGRELADSKHRLRMARVFYRFESRDPEAAWELVSGAPVP